MFFRLPDGARQREVPIAGLAGASVTAASRSLQGDLVATGTADGRVALVQVRFKPVFKDQALADLELEVRERGAFSVDPQKRPVRDVSYEESPEGAKLVAALVADEEIALVRVGVPAEDGTTPAPVLESVRTKPGTRSPA